MCKNAKLVLEAAVLLLDFLLQRRLEYSSRVLQNVYFMVFFEAKVSMKHNFVYQLTFTPLMNKSLAQKNWMGLCHTFLESLDDADFKKVN